VKKIKKSLDAILFTVYNEQYKTKGGTTMQNTLIQDMERQLATMQEQINALKQQPQTPQPSTQPDPYTDYQDQIENAQAELRVIFESMCKSHKVALVSTTISIANAQIGGFANGTSTCVVHTPDDINEDAMATALDVFSNPRRIKVLKVLIGNPLTGSEITQQTGLVGGQLYHHLSILENAQLIRKDGDKYAIEDIAQLMLVSLKTAVGGMEIGRE